MLFTIRFINLFFMHNIRLQNFEFKYLIDDIVINLGTSRNFASMKDI